MLWWSKKSTWPKRSGPVDLQISWALRLVNSEELQAQAVHLSKSYVCSDLCAVICIICMHSLCVLTSVLSCVPHMCAVLISHACDLKGVFSCGRCSHMFALMRVLSCVCVCVSCAFTCLLTCVCSRARGLVLVYSSLFTVWFLLPGSLVD